MNDVMIIAFFIMILERTHTCDVILLMQYYYSV